MSVGDLTLNLAGLGRRFGDRWVLRDVTMNVQGPTLVGVRGSNGSGKSTLLQLLAQLLAPSAGTIDICGHPVGRDAPSARALVAFVPHRPVSFPGRSVEENLQLAARFSRVAGPDEHVRSAAKFWGLEALLDRPVSSLSAGLVQRYSFARAEVVAPRMLLLDEPDSNLDADGRQQLAERLRTWMDRHIVIMSSHDAELLATASQVLDLDGRQ